MDKQLVEPLSGFRDYNNPTKDWVTTKLRTIFQQFGYQALETPSLEKQDILLGKLGEESQKLLYLFDDNGGRKVGLRYDLTVPLSRFVAANFGSLTYPFKRYEIGSSWRAERPQKGRYRQFTQADIDIIGDDGSLSSEKELIEVVALAAQVLGLDFTLKINDRRIVTDILNHFDITDTALQSRVMIIIDKKDKLEIASLRDELKKLGELSDIQLRNVEHAFLSANLPQDIVDAAVKTGYEQIQKLVKFAKSLQLKAEFDLSLMRGLDYYTGTVMECVVDGVAGSFAGGGRYDSLIEKLTGSKLPSIGISFGVDRIVDYLETRELPNDTIFLANLPETSLETENWAAELRAQGKKVERYLDETKELGKQIKYASKRGYKEMYLPMEDEWRRGEIVCKNLETGEQKSVKRASI